MTMTMIATTTMTTMTNTIMTTMRAQAWYCLTSEHGQEANISYSQERTLYPALLWTALHIQLLWQWTHEFSWHYSVTRNIKLWAHLHSIRWKRISVSGQLSDTTKNDSGSKNPNACWLHNPPIYAYKFVEMCWNWSRGTMVSQLQMSIVTV
jgi:hypothetical protein